MRRLWACLVVALVGCAPHVTSNVQIDGTPFVPSACRSGQSRGFAGVELEDGQRRRLRLAQAVDGQFQAIYFPPGASVGESLGTCGTMTFQNGVGVVNGVRNVEGSATLSCGTGKYKVTGDLAFKRCH